MPSYDQAAIDGMREKGYFQYIGAPDFWTSGALLYNSPLDDIDERIADAQDAGWCFVGDNVVDVAEKSDLPDLAATVEAYNGYCAAGEDPQFFKRAGMLQPVKADSKVYVFKFNPGAFNTFGGCRTDQYGRACDADYRPIDGLYIAGVENGSLYCRPYYVVGGTCCGLAYSSGRLAGQQMAAYVNDR